MYDAHIVATMLAYGERQLLTFNGADFRRFRSVIDIVVPRRRGSISPSVASGGVTHAGPTYAGAKSFLVACWSMATA